MRRAILALLAPAALLLAIGLPDPGLAERRAIVIGNDAYREVPQLRKAVNDARAVSERLSALGFEVTTLLDGDRRSTSLALQRFTDAAGPGDALVFYYAGHGIEIEGQNYLLPVDIPGPGGAAPDFLKGEAIALAQVLGRLRGTGAMTIAFIDACRDNPYARTGTRSLGRSVGLGRIAAPEGSFVVFSAGAGQAALDRLSEEDPDPNSVFTRALLPLLDRPGLGLREMTLTLRREVAALARSVDHRQTPAYYDELMADFAFRAGKGGAAQGEGTGGLDPIAAAFAAASRQDTRAAWEGFLAAHGEAAAPALRSVAEERLAALGARETRDAAGAAPAETPPADPLAGFVEAADPRRSEAVLSPDEVIAVQQALARLGFDPGPADGELGARTRAALADWQGQRGEPRTGMLTPAQRAALLGPGGAGQGAASATADPGARTGGAAGGRTGVFRDSVDGPYVDALGCARTAAGAVISCPAGVSPETGSANGGH